MKYMFVVVFSISLIRIQTGMCIFRMIQQLIFRVIIQCITFAFMQLQLLRQSITQQDLWSNSIKSSLLKYSFILCTCNLSFLTCKNIICILSMTLLLSNTTNVSIFRKYKCLPRKRKPIQYFSW